MGCHRDGREDEKPKQTPWQLTSRVCEWQRSPDWWEHNKGEVNSLNLYYVMPELSLQNDNLNECEETSRKMLWMLPYSKPLHLSSVFIQLTLQEVRRCKYTSLPWVGTRAGKLEGKWREQDMKKFGLLGVSVSQSVSQQKGRKSGIVTQKDTGTMYIKG